MSRDSRFEQQPLRCMANYYDHDGSISHPHEMDTSFRIPSERRIPDLMANYTGIRSYRAQTGCKETQQYQYRRMRQRPAKTDRQTLDAPRIVLDQTSLDSPTNDSTVMTPTEQSDVSIDDASQQVNTSTSRWQPQQRRYCSSVGYNKIWPAIVAGALLAFVIAFFPATVTYLDISMWRWGSASSGTLSFGATGGATKTTIFNAWLANMPQVLLSLCYINLNAPCTAMASTAKWNSLAVSRKGFRVTNPRGNQRSTYFLQLPYKWATPLVMTSGGLHWVLSRTFFFSRVDYYGSDGELDRWTSTCGISFSGLVTFSVACLILMIAIRWIGRRPMVSNLPLAENCSLLISAACHPSPSEVDQHLEKVKWGVIPGTGWCSLSSKHVEAPEVGKVYT